MKSQIKVLITRFRKLEAEGIVIRTVMPTSPPTVEYSLSELGKELKPAIEAIVRGEAIVRVGKKLKALKSETSEQE